MSCTFEARVLAYYKLSPVKILQLCIHLLTVFVVDILWINSILHLTKLMMNIERLSKQKWHLYLWLFFTLFFSYWLNIAIFQYLRQVLKIHIKFMAKQSCWVIHHNITCCLWLIIRTIDVKCILIILANIIIDVNIGFHSVLIAQLSDVGTILIWLLFIEITLYLPLFI